MNYIFRLAGDTDKQGRNRFVAHVKIESWRRPSLGTELKLPVSAKTWRVVGILPPTNPEDQQNTYLIEEV